MLLFYEISWDGYRLILDLNINRWCGICLDILMYNIVKYFVSRISWVKIQIQVYWLVLDFIIFQALKILKYFSFNAFWTTWVLWLFSLTFFYLRQVEFVTLIPNMYWLNQCRFVNKVLKTHVEIMAFLKNVKIGYVSGSILWTFMLFVFITFKYLMKQRFRIKNEWDFCQKPWKKVFSTNYYVRNSLSTDTQF